MRSVMDPMGRLGSRRFLIVSSFIACRFFPPHPSRLTLSVQSFKDGRNTLAAADAHRHQCITPAAALQFVERFNRDDAAGGADRMAEADAAAAVSYTHLRAHETRHDLV